MLVLVDAKYQKYGSKASDKSKSLRITVTKELILLKA